MRGTEVVCSVLWRLNCTHAFLSWAVQLSVFRLTHVQTQQEMSWPCGKFCRYTTVLVIDFKVHDKLVSQTLKK